MADAAIGATVQVVLDAVISVASERIGLLLGFNKELKSLRESATMIQAVLTDAETKQEQNQAVKLWLKRLEGVAFDTDHLFDELNYEILRRKVKSRNQQLKGTVCSFFFSLSCANIAFRSRMASKIRDIKIKLDRITQEADKFGLIIGFQIEPPLPASVGATTSRQTDSVVVPNVVGRDKDESRIVEMLLGPSEKSVSVISIAGMGGLGKTTLAKSVYNNPQIDEHFGKKIWVCVAKKVEILELFKLILESSTRAKVEVDNRDAIVHNIGRELEEKRFFLVLDDVWNHEQGLWADFFTTLEGLNVTNGNWCLVTTRLEQVASTLSRHLKMNVGPYMLGKLSKDECWSIIKEKVVGVEEVPKELEAIKKQILRRCDGLPLAASLIGGLLLQRGKEEWQLIVEKSLLNGDQNDIKQILKVSFDHLSPASVKKCFAYCSIFSQDTELEKDLLIELWMAEGFLQLDQKSQSLMEDMGDKYFKILLQSSLLECVGKNTYKMHDLVHDFAKSILNPESSNQDRYLALNSFEGIAENVIKEIPTSLRTLFLESSISSHMLSKFEYLHVLKLSGADVDVLPTSIGKLIHLRLLDVSDSRIKGLPESLSKLYNLQTLRTHYNIFDSVEGGFPKQMSDLISLRHLHYYDHRAEFQMPLEIGRLTCLQTLKFFNIGQENGRGIEELGTLKDLKGVLTIRNLELVNGKQGAKLAKLSEKPNLSGLDFEWGSEDRDGRNCDYYVLEGLQPHSNLQKLVIKKFMGDKFPLWLMNLSTLVQLELKFCNTCTELPALGQFPFLERLELCKLDNIKCIGLSFYGIINKEESGSSTSHGIKEVMPRTFFPALKYLYLGYMGNLVEWKDADEVRRATGEEEVHLFPMLKTLIMEYCSQLTTAPCHFPSIEAYSCHILLAEKILSNITLSDLDIDDDMVGTHDSRQYLNYLFLERQFPNKSSLVLRGCGNIPSEMIEHCPNLTSLRRSRCGHLSPESATPGM